MNNETDVSIRFKNYVTGEGKLEKYAQTLAKIKSFTDGMDSAKIKSIESSASATKELNSETKQMAKNVNTAFNFAVVNQFLRGLKSVVTTMGKLTDKSANYLENINLFQVAFGEGYKEATKFVNKMSEMYGLDESQLTRTVGIFKQLSNAMNLSTEQGTKLAELLTQMTIDISSLYNIEEIERSSSILQSALAGQTKPIRGSTGGDITESTLQTTLNDIGLDKYVGDLTYAEKRLLIIISLTKQLEESTNDFGKTIESPANQMRILSQQWERVSRAVGNVFLPILAKVLPYLNAILMVLTEIINMVATLVGYNEDDYDYFTGVADSVLDLEESLGGATEKAKELKQGLRGFDKLNVIKTPSANDSGGGAGGIDPKIMDAFNDAFDEYQSKLENVTMKATIIRDKIMEWLGFTKKINEVTGDVYWKFEKLTGGTVLGALGVGGTIYAGVYGIVNLFKKLGFGTLFSGFGKLLSGFGKITGLTKAFETIGIALKGSAVGAWSLKEAMSLILSTVGAVASKLGGVGLIISGVVVAINGIKDAISGDLFNGISDALQGIALLVGGIGLFINPVITLIALAVAGVIELVQVVVKNWEKISDFFKNVWKTFNETIIKPISNFVSSVADFVYDKAIEPIINFFKPIADAIIEIWQLVITKTAEIVTGVGKALGAIFSKIGEIFLKIVEIFVALGKAGYDYIIKPFIGWIGDLFTTAYNKFIKPFFDGIVWLSNKINEKFIQPFIDAIVGLATTAYNKFIKPFFDWVVWLKDKVVGIFKGIGTTVVTFISDLFKSVINGVLGAIESGINKFIKLLNSAIGIINEIPGVNITKVSLLKIPRLEKGMDFVPKDFYGPVYLDYGERVLTKEENRDYSAGLLASGNQTQRSVTLNPTFVIQVGDEVIAKKVLTDLQDMAKSDGKPIVIS